MKKVTMIFRQLFRVDGSCIQVYRIVGVATAALAESLPKPPGARLLLRGILFSEDFMKKLGAIIALYP
jgi:hypothetical protein